MSWLLDMTREEREQSVIRLYNEGRTFKDIAKEIHMSFRDIGAIIERYSMSFRRASPINHGFKLVAVLILDNYY